MQLIIFIIILGTSRAIQAVRSVREKMAEQRRNFEPYPRTVPAAKKKKATVSEILTGKRVPALDVVPGHLSLFALLTKIGTMFRPLGASRTWRKKAGII